MTSYPIPYVITRSSAGERSADIYSRRLAERIIYLGTPIDDGVANAYVGQAVAGAALLIAGGTPGGRQLLPHARVVVHTPAAEGRGTVPDLILEAEEVERLRTQQEAILGQHTSRSPDQVRRDMERNLNAERRHAARQTGTGADAGSQPTGGLYDCAVLACVGFLRVCRLRWSGHTARARQD